MIGANSFTGRRITHLSFLNRLFLTMAPILACGSVPVSAANILADGSFEMQSQQNSLGGSGIFDSDACLLSEIFGGACRVRTPWSANGRSVFLLKGGTEFANGVVSPEGNFHAMVAGDGQLFQYFVAPRSGDYVLSWLEGGARQPDYTTPLDYFAAVFGSENGYQGQFVATQFQAFTKREMYLPGLIGGATYQLSFIGFGRCCTTGALMLDDVSIESTASTNVPEPSSWALLVLGFGIVGAGLRTRQRGRLQPIG